MKKEKKTENKVGQKGKTRRWGKRRKRRELRGEEKLISEHVVWGENSNFLWKTESKCRRIWPVNMSNRI